MDRYGNSSIIPDTRSFKVDLQPATYLEFDLLEFFFFFTSSVLSRRDNEG